MYLIKRTTTAPNSPLAITVDRKDPDSTDAGFSGGGSFLFMPAGDPDGNDQAQVDEHCAKALMLDPGNAVHFSCEPPLPGAAGAAAGDAAAGKRKKRKDADAPA